MPATSNEPEEEQSVPAGPNEPEEAWGVPVKSNEPEEERGVPVEPSKPDEPSGPDDCDMRDVSVDPFQDGRYACCYKYKAMECCQKKIHLISYREM